MTIHSPNGEQQRICPFMSGTLAPVQAGPIVPGGRDIAVAPMLLPCQGERCQAWDRSRSDCALKPDPGLREVLGNLAVALVEVADGLRVFEPPSCGSPMLRAAEALERLADSRQAGNSGGKVR